MVTLTLIRRGKDPDAAHDEAGSEYVTVSTI